MATTSSSKVYPDAASALRGVIKDGITLMCGGFGLCGIPERLIDALRDSGVRNLTVVSNNCGIDGAGLGLLLQSRQIRKMISLCVGEHKGFVHCTQYRSFHGTCAEFPEVFKEDRQRMLAPEPHSVGKSENARKRRGLRQSQRAYPGNDKCQADPQTICAAPGGRG